MNNQRIFQDDKEWEAALEADVAAAGGPQVVGHILWPHLDPITAGKKASNAANPKQRQEFTPKEIRRIKSLARAAAGRSQLHAVESGELDCEIKWTTLEEKIELANQGLAAAMESMQGQLAQVQRWLAEINKQRANR